MTQYIECTPAYGRDYTSAKAVQKDWDANKDFMINDISHPDNGRYINKQDAKPGTTLNIRFKNFRNIAVIKVK